MKQIHYIFVLACLLMLNVSCEREYMAPPLSEPKYEGILDNMTIKQLKQRYADIIAPQLIEEELIIKGIVTGNDESGNIYKQIYIQDASGAINIGIDQNSIYASHQVGQEIFVHLKDFYMVKYGGELQIGMGNTQANRISWEIFKSKSFLNSWPNANNAVPKVVELNALTEDMVHTLVEIKDVTFVNGGKKPFTTGDATTNERITNASGNGLDVRSSNFSTFAKDMLPEGKGTIVGILSRFNGGWQLFLRTIEDVKDFDGQAPEAEQPQAGSFFKETFGTGTHNSLETRPKIKDFTGFDMKAPVQYMDASDVVDIRTTSTINPHVWFPSNRDASLKVSGINTMGKGEVSLSFELAANVGREIPTANMTDMQININGTAVAFPNQILDNSKGDGNKYYKVSIPNIAQSENLTIEFVSTADKNKAGFRLDNIELTGAAAGSGDGGNSGAPIIVTP